MNKYSFENFYLNMSNKRAFLVAQEVAQNPGGTLNPLYIYGGPQTGKTHLLYSIERFITEHFPEKRVVLITAEEFCNEVIQTIRTGLSAPKRIEEFREKYRNADVLLFDDVDFLNGKHSTQDEFLHSFNCLYEAGKQIVMTGKTPPHKQVGKMEMSIVSRLGWGVMVEIPEGPYALADLAEPNCASVPAYSQVVPEKEQKTIELLESELKREKQRNPELEKTLKKLGEKLTEAACVLNKVLPE